MSKHLNEIPIEQLQRDNLRKGTEYQISDGRIVSSWTPSKNKRYGRS